MTPQLIPDHTSNRPALVIYHSHCWDGFCAAWIARNALGPNTNFHAAHYGSGPPDVKGRHVYIFDFSYPLGVMKAIRTQASLLVVRDHHKTAQQTLESLTHDAGRGVDILFNLEKSGGRLAWEYFYSSAPAPWIVDYTEDRDLWRWALPKSRAINASLRSYPLDFTGWDALDVRDADDLVEEGQAILRREQQIVSDHVHHAREMEVGGHKVLAVNATVLVSEIAGELARDRPFGACFFQRTDGQIEWSLRSRDGGIDVSEIAKSYGGGGHPQAAGFTTVSTVCAVTQTSADAEPAPDRPPEPSE